MEQSMMHDSMGTVESQKSPAERRRSPRITVDLPLEYRTQDFPAVHGGHAVNASETGIQIRSTKNLPVGEKLNIMVLFPSAFELANFEVIAEIVWKRPQWTGNWQGFQYGLKFVRLENDDFLKLQQILNSQGQTENISVS